MSISQQVLELAAWQHELRGAHGEWITALGDPTTAQHVLTYIPGTSTAADIPNQLAEAQRVKNAMDGEFQGSTAVVYWRGFQPPPDLHHALRKEDAIRAAASLAQFQSLMKSENPGAHFTVLGHSYGSLVAGEAAGRHGMRPQDMVFVGSPGVGFRHASELGLEPGHVWAGQHSQDPIKDAAEILEPDYKGNPVHPRFGARVFNAETPGVRFPGLIPGPAHKSYFSYGSEALGNIGRIATGKYADVGVMPLAAIAASNIADQVLNLAAWQHEARNLHGEWSHGEGLPGSQGPEGHGFKGQFTGADVYRPGMQPAAGHEALSQPGRPEGVAAGTAADPIDVHGSMQRAVELMAAGQHVRLNSPAEVPGLMDEINRQGDAEMQRTGAEPPWDLSNISVRGTRLFNEQTIGTPRQDMPQLNGPAEPGTEAAVLAGGANRFVELDPEFRAQLKTDGIAVKNEHVPVSELRATQTQLTATSVAGIYRAARNGNPKVLRMLREPLWATRENYVLDGHHRWAADTALKIASGQYPGGQIEVQRIDLPARIAVDYARQFAQGMGIGGRALGNAKLVEASGIAAQVLDLGWQGWRTESRDSHGRWTRGGVAAAIGIGGLVRKAGHALSETPEEASFRHSLQPASPEIHDFTAKAADKVPGLLGGGTQGFSGRVWTADKLDQPGSLAEMRWDGDMVLRSDIADTLHHALTSGKPADPGPVEDVLHELIHGVTATGTYEGEHGENRKAYQDLTTASIEEGFTELGAIQHAREFFDAMGLGDHETTDTAFDQASGRFLVGKHSTFDENAAGSAEPQNIAAGYSWGHYETQVSGAYGWVQQIAEMEGAGDNAARIIELSNQINQRGAAGKVDVMAAQVLSAAAKATPGGWQNLKITPSLLDSMRQEILGGFAAGGGIEAAKRAAPVAQARLAALAAERAA